MHPRERPDPLLAQLADVLASETTRKSYLAKLRHAVAGTGAGDVSALVSSPHRHYPSLKELYPDRTTRRNVLTAVMAVLKHTDHGIGEKSTGVWARNYRRLGAKLRADAPARAAARTEEVSLQEMRDKLHELVQRADCTATLRASMRLSLLALAAHVDFAGIDFSRVAYSPPCSGEKQEGTEKRTSLLVLAKDKDKARENKEEGGEKKGSGSHLLVLLANGRRRRVDLPSPLARILRRDAKRHPRDFLFVDRRGEPYTTAAFGKFVQRTFTDLFGRPVGVQALRRQSSSTAAY